MTPEEQLKAAVYAVESTFFEKHALWCMYAIGSPYSSRQYPRKVIWRQDAGFLEIIGEVDKRPVAISCMFDLINGHYVMFYDVTSELADWKMAEAWLNENVPAYAKRNRTDAMNFSHCLSALEGL